MSFQSLQQNLYYILLAINLMLAISVIFLERRNIGATWAWLMVFLFLPVIGFVLYLVFGQNLSRMKIYKVRKESKERIDRLIQRQRNDFKERRLVYNDPAAAEYEDLIYMNLSSAMALYSQDNSVDLYTDGPSKFEALLRDLEQAKEHIHLVYYIVNNDGIGRKLLECLTRKALEGVKVRFLYDPVGSHRLPAGFFSPLERAGGETSAFFPSRIPYLNFRVNYRNHRKLVIVDGRIGYIGGFNVGDEYMGLDRRFGYWRDTHLRIMGSAVQQMQARFILDWRLASKRELEEVAGLFPPPENNGRIGMQIVASGPDQAQEQIRNAYIRMIHHAKESVWIETPYFIPDESLLNALQMAALSGVDVRIIIPGIPDHQMVYWATHSYLGDLLPLGVKCYLYQNGFLHAKSMVVDGKAATVGTANFDIRSFKLNFEVNAILYDQSVARQLQAIFQKDMAHSQIWTLDDYMKRPRSHKFRESVTRLLSPIL
ncbi:cardiolipin synthase [Cohnella lubricantis]|uniref:Cardiolipin synthase n=1 Tax=Cohnella lubricantis TaxID=2163172 RepID=A0A841TC56_9BACL|nr:cardiolipin synthase [Cohnella lubricantis]MBB6676958.1 cardiolipin synthase [Cohnella lubricantis]MBP2118363.1 cardiolipin synthase [Cohnella lubricantis]